jgi:hypothetical protein
VINLVLIVVIEIGLKEELVSIPIEFAKLIICLFFGLGGYDCKMGF